MSRPKRHVRGVWWCGAAGCATYVCIHGGQRRMANAVREGWQRAVGQRDGRKFEVTRCPAHAQEFAGVFNMVAMPRVDPQIDA